ncbi:Methionine ABC transporter ATP-binding protein [Serinibacter arcticus]|uniref:Methionine ABC transporter ATP-binding protein n=1 Tax=Serinibacter arcticus TaxID=1655435 RepID=A0A4Z1E4C8_9MICO|nr:Methionine ABC transporter ATP-binding protein [Serinibacter arcticus]
MRAAALLALGFILVRLVYQALFRGLDRGGRVLVDLPSHRLPDPVDHVVLLGPITTQGITTAIVSALPIAAIILAFGVLNGVVDLAAVCARASRGGPLRSVAQALVIAWATFPGLVRSVTDVRRARRLRGERGAASLLVPVMERTVERAVALGASMEVRGFASSTGHAPDASGAGTSAVELRDVTLAHDGGWTLRADLTLPRGALVLLTGPTGSGKSTLLRALSGLHTAVDGGTLAGEARVLGVDRDVAPHATAALVGVVPQHPRLSFVAETVAAEIAFASAVQGASDAEVDARVARAAQRFDLEALLGTATSHLSAGQSHLVALAAATAHAPALVLVDEPLADLDLASRTRVVTALRELAADGTTVLVAEHRVAALREVADVELVVAADDGGARVVVADPGVAEVAPASAGPLDAVAPRDPVTGDPVLRAHDVTLAVGGRVLLSEASLDVAAGEIVAVTGDVGSGKTTLLNHLALPRRGTARVGGTDVATLRRRPRLRALALVPDASDDLLFRLTVAEECARADRRAGAAVGASLARFRAFAVLPDGEGPASDVAVRHPRDLSVGQRRLLVLAVQLAATPRVLLVDEPSRGLDPVAAAAVRRALRATAEAGTAVVIATHDVAFTALADRVLALEDARLVPRAVPALESVAKVRP